jgi:hypothetical protein
MRWLFKWLFRLVLLIVALAVGLFLSKDAILRAVTEHRIRKQTGMDVSIGSLSGGLFSPVVTIRNLKLYNTADFGGGLFADVPELHVEYDPVALADQRLRVTLMRLKIAELDIVINQQGQTNVLSMVQKIRTHQKQPGGKKVFGKFDFEGIEMLNLTLENGRAVDLRKNGDPRIVPVHLESQAFPNVKSGNDVRAILGIVWLRSGGQLPLVSVPALTKDLLNKPNRPTAPQNAPALR